ncbi:MAG: HupE/UreJ family protein [Chromatiales bacterium]|nr:HupE/UreJ family protein [Chromatiales bacterium]
MRFLIRLFAVLLSALAMTCAHAHPPDALALGAGLAHPLTGTDHLLVVTGLGLWAAISRPQRYWSIASALFFGVAAGYGLAVMAPAGAGLHVALPASVAIVGLVVAAALRFPEWIAWLLAAGAGALQAVVHAAPTGLAGQIDFEIGLLLSTLVLYAGGLGVGRWLHPGGVRLLGILIATAGTGLAWALH